MSDRVGASAPTPNHAHHHLTKEHHMTTTDGYAVTIWASFEQPAVQTVGRLSDLAGVLVDHGAAVGAGPNGFSVTMSIDVDADQDELVALEAARNTLRRATSKLGLPAWTVTAAEVLTYDEQDRRLSIPVLPELIGNAEIAELLGVSKARVSQLRSLAGFPTPAAQLASGPVYTRPSIQRFLDEWKREPGRPSKTTTI